MSLYRLFLFLTTAVTLMFSAYTYAVDGVIHFTGSVVESDCNISQIQSSVQASCYRDGRVISQTRPINESNGKVLLPKDLGWTQIVPVGKEKNLKLLTINYY
ncbi:hypothetical protein [Hafnia alvei]|uniref:Type 1 fimbrial protein n=1 Tax=Hafnia alvei TaxID=569 RepID=A0A1C6Z5B3_HAFAL|nr:hypothetical protein [Hafnia alvei]NLS55040.1 hypothetical protein [Hafnia alvei]SCM54402.1 hypothetical protein BN1044_03905 [Hafnia alvei]